MTDTVKVLVNVVEIKSKRPHRQRRWDTYGKYHARVQKKWDKRFGMQKDVKVLSLPQATYLKLKELGGPYV